ncbi:MAG: desulfoferrodoxin [Candidatus Bathyarchaeota archaeon]|nr:desulfoferrodoxin [Candidatus Bathyarchaeota archaeon]
MTKKKGEKYKCKECGLIVVVEDLCGWETVELLCCEM